MSITSLYFALFVVFVLLVYYLLPQTWRKYWLLFVSYVFYLTWNWKFAVVLLVMTLVNYGSAWLIKRRGTATPWILWFGIIFDLAVLAFFKYSHFFLPRFVNLLSSLGGKTSSGSIQILLPVGLSFYCLGAISYLIDVYRGQVKLEISLVDFALYMAYFPKLLSGPIERARSFIPKFIQPQPIDLSLITRNVSLILVGVVRKLVFADTLSAMIPPEAFTNPQAYNTLNVWAWLLAYAFSLYNDFAGYTSVVRGVSGLFGIELSVNFQTPYFSRNFTEFWNAWHITLSQWLRDYIYFPVTRSLLRHNNKPRSLPNLVIPPVVTMLASGLWHHASLNMLVWGVLHGLFQVVERLPTLWRPVIPPDKQPRRRQILAGVVVFLLAILVWVPFRMDLPVALAFWGRLFSWTKLVFHETRIMIIVAFALGLDVVQYFKRDELVFLHWPRLARATLLALAVLAVFLVTRADTGASFVYQGF